MSIFRNRRHADLDVRVAEAQDRAKEAEGQAELSRARQEKVRKHVVTPLRRAAEHNQFAEMLRASLIGGHGGKP